MISDKTAAKKTLPDYCGRNHNEFVAGYRFDQRRIIRNIKHGSNNKHKERENEPDFISHRKFKSKLHYIPSMRKLNAHIKYPLICGRWKIRKETKS